MAATCGERFGRLGCLGLFLPALNLPLRAILAHSRFGLGVFQWSWAVLAQQRQNTKTTTPVLLFSAYLSQDGRTVQIREDGGARSRR